MKYLSMEIMTRHIKTNLLIIIIIIFFHSCKKQDKKTLSNSVINEIENISIWNYSSKNINDTYSQIQIQISKDSLKVYNINSKEYICKGEIIKSDRTFENDIKTQLENKLLLKLNDNIEVIENSESSISKKGCQFPFYELFISNNALFFFDKEYYYFTQKKERVSQKTNSKFPITSENLLKEKIKTTNHTKGFENYTCGEEILEYYQIDSKKWVIASSCYDFEYKDLVIIDKNKKIISKLLIERESWDIEKKELEDIDDKETVNFVIEKDNKIKITTRHFLNKKLLSTIIKTYKITAQGKIEEIK